MVPTGPLRRPGLEILRLRRRRLRRSGPNLPLRRHLGVLISVQVLKRNRVLLRRKLSRVQVVLRRPPGLEEALRIGLRRPLRLILRRLGLQALWILHRQPRLGTTSNPLARVAVSNPLVGVAVSNPLAKLGTNSNPLARVAALKHGQRLTRVFHYWWESCLF